MESDSLWDELKGLSARRTWSYNEQKEHLESEKRHPKWKEPDCGHKVRFRSKSAAKNKMRGRGCGFRAKVYFCKRCEGYHIANRDK